MSIKKTIITLAAILLTTLIYSDGFIIIERDRRIFPPPRPRPHPRPIPPHFHPFPLEVKTHHVTTTINNQLSETNIDQIFHNPTNHNLEGYYLFPVPPGAVIKTFSMYINGKETQAELLDATKARRIYEDIVRRRQDPALLEYMGQSLFKARIFPIEPYSDKRVKISYRQLLTKENGTIEYLYPLNTEKFSAKPLHDVSITVTIKSDEIIKNIYCPTHETDILRKNKNHAVVAFEQHHTTPDRDFKVYYNTDNKKLGFSLLTYKKNRDGYFFLSLSPGYSSSEDEISEKDITFVLDVSGSMAGKKLQQAKKALLFCVENLNKNDRFEIIRFSTEAEALFEKLTPANETSREKAREFIDQLKAIGGTNIDEALTQALNMKKQSGRPYMIIFLTDGKPTIGETDENRLVKQLETHNIAGTRIFTFGIGHELNTHLLDKIAQTSRGFRTYISPTEDIEIKVSDFYSNVQSPILTDIQLKFGSHVRVSKTYPRQLPDLFKGSSLTLLGRYSGHGDADIRLSGNIRGITKEFRFHAPEGFVEHSKSHADEFIAPLWAARRIGYLLDQIRLQGKEQELVEEVTHLARTYGIITPYTSYLIVEDEEQRVQRRQLRPEDQTLSRITDGTQNVQRKSREDYAGMKSKTGSSSVQAGKEFQQMNKAETIAGTRPGAARMNYTDKEGTQRNISQQVRNIQGRAVYNTGGAWIDSQVSVQQRLTPKQQVHRIQFAGEKYFQLLKDEPESAQFLALGKNVRFVINNTIYHIYQ